MQASLVPPPLLWRVIGSRDRSALVDLNNDCFPLRYEDDFYDSVCGNRPGVISMAAFEGEDMVAAIVLRCAPASNFEDAVVSTWRSWGSWDDPIVVYICTIAVAPRRRRMGLGVKMMRWAFSQCDDVQASCIYLHVLPDNCAALNLYENMGFLRLNLLRNFYIIEGRHFDSVVLARHFRDAVPPLSLARFTSTFLFGASSKLKQLLTCGHE